VIPGEKRVEIALTDGLRDIRGPRSGVLDEARRSGFVAETLDFRIGNETTNELSLRSRYREFNLQLDYQTPDLMSPGQLTPLNLQLAWDSLEGYGGTFGTWTPQGRELFALGSSRLLGATLSSPIRNGEATFLVGQPASGSTVVNDVFSVPEYGGLALGGRFVHENGWEAGFLSGIDESGNGTAGVASLMRDWHNPTSRLGDATHHQELDVGLFGVEGDDSGLDLRGRWDSRFRLSDPVTVSTRLSYQGPNFSRPFFTGEDVAVGQVADHLLAGINMSVVPSEWMATSLRGSFAERGLRVDDPALEGRSAQGGLNVQLRPWRRGPWLDVDYSISSERLGPVDPTSRHRLRASVSQQWRRLEMRLLHDTERGDLERELTSLSLARPFNRLLPRRAWLRFTPRLSAAMIDGDSRIDIGGFLSLDSGDWLGQRLGVGLEYARLDPLVTLESEGDEGTQYVTAHLRYALRPDLHVEMTWGTSLNGESRFLTLVRGSLGFNRVRRLRRPVAGTGVLMGTVFLDEDWDGIRDPDEKPLPGAPVRLRGLPLRVRSDRDGGFTIQNLRRGSYEVTVDIGALPLGTLLGLERTPRLRVSEDEVTEIDIPLVQSAQIYGIVFEDANGNDRADPGERGLEGLRLRLEPGSLEGWTTAFGQFSFEGLRPGEYAVFVDEGPEVLPAVRVAIPAWTQATPRLEIPARPRR
jgi:hypothetical protein